jgi:hypothetical protein
MRAIIEFRKSRWRDTLDHENTQRECVKQLLKSEEIVRKFPVAGAVHTRAQLRSGSYGI